MFSLKLVCVFAVIAVFALQNANATGPPVLGGINQLQGKDLDEVKETLRGSLHKLAQGEGPRYKLTRLITASRQTVSGDLYRIHAELANDNNQTKICNITIWSQPWLPQGIEVTFECDGEDKIVKKHDP